MAAVLAPLAPRRRWVPSARGVGVLVFGLWCLVRGVSLLSFTNPPPDVLRAYGPGVHISVVVGLWVTGGVWCLVAVAVRRWRWAMTFVVALHAGWAVSAAGSWILTEYDRGWVTACAYLLMATCAGVISTMRDVDRDVRPRRGCS